MEKDEAQLFKAQTKTNAIIKITTAIQEMNSILEPNEIKAYEIKLSYEKINEYYKFTTDIYKGTAKPEKIFNIKFSLNNLNQGNFLFGKIIDSFNKGDIVYYGFLTNPLNNHHDSFFIKGKNNVQLSIKINNITEEQKFNLLKEKMDLELQKKSRGI